MLKVVPYSDEFGNECSLESLERFEIEVCLLVLKEATSDSNNLCQQRGSDDTVQSRTKPFNHLSDKANDWNIPLKCARLLLVVLPLSEAIRRSSDRSLRTICKQGTAGKRLRLSRNSSLISDSNFLSSWYLRLWDASRRNDAKDFIWG